MRNIVNEDAIKTYLKQLAGGDDRLAANLILALFKALLKEDDLMRPASTYPAEPPDWLTPEYFARREFYEFDPALLEAHPYVPDAIAFVRDWLKMAMSLKERWLERVDGEGRVLRLRNIGTMSKALDNADKDIRKWTTSRRIPRHEITGVADPWQHHFRTEIAFADGWRWKELMTAMALKNEGRLMRHCVGSKPYIGQLRRKEYRFFSLRNQHNRPILTLQCTDTDLLAYGGPCNDQPYHGLITHITALQSKFLWNLDVRVDKLGRFNVLGHTFDLTRMPDETIIPCSLLATDCFCKRLADRITVNGNLILNACADLTCLPEHLTVRRSLMMKRCNLIPELPDTLSVAEHVRVVRCAGLKRLPSKMHVRGNLCLEHCEALEALPQDWRVDLNLIIDACLSISQLPPGLRVGGDLIIRDCLLQGLPQDLQVGGNLEVKGLAMLPDRLRVGGTVTTRLGTFTSVAQANVVARIARDNEPSFALVPPGERDGGGSKPTIH